MRKKENKDLFNRKNRLMLTFIKRELRDLYKMSLKGVSVTNGTIDDSLITEINHFMATLMKYDKCFKPEFFNNKK